MVLALHRGHDSSKPAPDRRSGAGEICNRRVGIVAATSREEWVMVLEHVADWAWTLDFPRTRRGALLAKRALDIIVSAALLVLLAPLLAVAMVAIRISSPGAVVFVQRRIGCRCAEFDMYKFRTMLDGAERQETRLADAQADRTFLKITDDPRITTVGRLLRRYSIDELPQLFNVLRGDMSLLGPRPLLRSDLRRFPRASLMRRFAMKPGISGLWQVSGRSLLPDADRIRLDIDYVDNWSFTRDLAILARTIPVVIMAKGAV
jgi:lipopolysaccharide/colanic/teichoic acid biosynthesis glycosyltransferase